MNCTNWLSPFRPLAKISGVVILAVLALGTSASAQAPLVVEGSGVAFNDKSTFSSGTVTFRAPSTNGYTYAVSLDGNPVPTDLWLTVNEMDYHELSIWRTNASSGVVTNRVVRFIVRAADRGSPENGLMKWTPYPPIPSTAAEMAGAQMRVIAPKDYPQGLPIPVQVWVEDDQGRARRVNGFVTAPGFEGAPLQLFRGAGSVMLPPASESGALNYQATLPGLQTNKVIQIEAATVWTTRSGVLSASEVWPANSRIHLTASLTVPAGMTLTIEAGTVVKLNSLVNIVNNGRVLITGTLDEPVVFTTTNVVWPENSTGAWGGFIMRGSPASRPLLEVNGAIFTGGAGGTGWSFPDPSTSHKTQQPVILLSNAVARLTNSAIIHTAGQVGNGCNSDLTLDRTLCQRAITCGEYVGGTIIVNRSALIEFPNDDGVYDTDIADADYDGIYFTTGTHIIRDSVIGFAKDDAIDSGSGGAGTMLVTNCWVESALHEAHAWSGEGRQAWSYDTVLINSGQGIECGWSTGNNSPQCFADRLLTTGNSVGARVGDNYDWSYNGFLRLTNSLILHNYRDVFLKTWNGTGSGWQTNSWVDRLAQTDLRSSYLTAADPRYPANSVWSPAEDFWRLTNWMTIPGEAAVGCGVAVWTNRFGMGEIFGGLPVRLSHFTTNFVGVDYAFEDTSGVVLGTGRLEFAPGETVKRIYPAGFDVWRQSYVKVVLTGAQNGEVTGRAEAEYVGSVGAPQISCWAGTNQMGGYRMAEGMLVRLSVAGGQPVSVDYAYEAPAGTQKTGTLVFAPGETVKWADPSGVGGYEWVRLNLSGAEGGTLAGISSVLYTNPPLTVGFGVGASPMNVSAFSNGLPVVLSAPASAGVIVDFQYEAGGAVLTNGTLSFGAGQGLRVLSAPTVESQAYELIKVSLKGAQGAELAGVSNVYYLGGVERNDLPIALNAAWRYRDAASAAPANWNTNTFDHSGWPEGPAQLGFSEGEEGDEATLIGDNNQITSYFRRFFTVADPGVWTNLTLRLLRDDGGVVYLNGREVFRSPNLPSGTVTYSTTTGSPNGENTIDTATISTDFLRAGENLCAVEIHQASATSSDVSFALELKGNGAAVVAPAIVGPTNGQVFELGQSVGVSVNGGSASQGVVLYADTRAVATNAAGPYQYEVSGLGAGGHELVAVGLGTGGLRAMSAPVAIEVVGQDRDGDGMPDGWESAHGLNPDADDAELDLDGDGLKNGAEYVAGTDPQDPKSYLKIEKLEGAQGGGWGVTFEAVAGKSYAVEHAPGLPAASWTLLTNLTAAATGPITVSDSASASNRYYRIRIP